MYSLAWPDIFDSVNTKLLQDKDAIKSNLILLLNSDKLSLFGDPYYGTMLKPVIFQPNNNIIADLLIDELYTTIRTYIPQITVDRNSIRVMSDKIDLYVTINVIYNIDNTSDLYMINLTNNQQEG